MTFSNDDSGSSSSSSISSVLAAGNQFSVKSASVAPDQCMIQLQTQPDSKAKQ